MGTRHEFSEVLNAICALIACFAGGGALLADTADAVPKTWYVNAANSEKEGLDGLTVETAWGDLQTAHDKAAAGDIIKVMEGVYDKGGGKKFHARENRVSITKRLRFEAMGSVDRTHIVGELSDTSSKYGGVGMRAVCVTESGAGTVFRGFTIRNGSCGSGTKQPQSNNGDATAGGGGISCYGVGETAWKTAYFVDCVISNNAATWGGAMYGGTAIRCLIVDNIGSGYAGVCASAALLNSVVIGAAQLTGARTAVGTSSYIVNSLVAATALQGCGDINASYQSKCFNTLFTACGGTAMKSGPMYANCTNTSRGVYSPATFDFRPVAGMEADGNGKSVYLSEAWELLDVPEGIEMTDFNGNPIDLTKETCDIGAVQGTVENASGAVVIPLGTLVDGKAIPRYKTTYARASEWPKALVLTPSTDDFYAYKASGDVLNGLAYRFLQLDGTCHVMPPPFSSQSMTLAEVLYKYEYWCSPYADAATADGSEDNPFRTVQDAIAAATNAATTASGAAVINLLPGDYREGGEFAQSHSNRVVVPPGFEILVKSVEGAGRTTVFGKADPSPVDAAYAGCGPAAMRCVVSSGDAGCAFQGITFADGHSNFADSASDAVSDRAGGIYAGKLQILDCVVTNCTAVRGAAGYYGFFYRSKFYDCVSWSGVFRYGRLVSCHVDDSCRNGEKDGSSSFTYVSVLGSEQCALLCTAPVSHDDCSALYSMIFGEQKVSACNQYGSVFKEAVGVAGGAKGYSVQDPGFVDFAGGDLRLVTGTPAAEASATAIGERGTATWGAWATNIASFAQSDINGNRLRLINGKLLPGCYHTTVDGIYLSASKGGVDIPGAEKGKFIPLSDLPLAVMPVAGDRPCVGMLANGVTNRFDEGISFSAGDVTAAGGGIYAEAIYTTDWYVDPDGDDNACGFTPKTAKKSLSAAMAKAASGDTVHAAEGFYRDGAVKTSGLESHPAARVYIPSGRKLVADGAAEKTFIVGQLGTDEFTDAIGCGSNSVRCVYMGANTVLKGFTLMNGSAYPAGNGTGDYGEVYNCGAVYGVNRKETFVQDCIISNCAAFNATAGREVSFINCRIFENRAKRGVTSECHHYGCVIDRNYANVATVHKHTRLLDTTIGPNAYKLDGSAGVALGQVSSSSAQIGNCLVLGLSTTDKMAIQVSNCVFAIHGKSDFNITNNSYNSRFVDIGELQVDENLRPIAGANAACDIADASLEAASAALTEMVMKLRERANNGNRLDAGALEADWRECYASDVGGRSFTVVSASNSAEETTLRTVLLPDGAALSGEWANPSGRMRTYLLRFSVPADATLSLTAAGRSMEFATGSHECRIASADESVGVELVSSGGTAEIFSGGWMRGTMMVIR